MADSFDASAPSNYQETADAQTPLPGSTPSPGSQTAVFSDRRAEAGQGVTDAASTTNQPVFTPGSADSESGGADNDTPVTGGKTPKVLADHPQVSDDTKALIERKKANRLPDYLAANNEELMGYYEYMAKLDPTSATYDPPAHTYQQLTRGGLQQIAKEHLGRRPIVDPNEQDANARREQVQAQLDYDQKLELYVQLLHRMNVDTMVTPDHIAVGQRVRVPTEFV